MVKKKPGFSTRAIHSGQAPDPSTGSVMPPVYLTSTYVQESIGVHQGYEYARGDNPTREAYHVFRCLAHPSGQPRPGRDTAYRSPTRPVPTTRAT